MPRAAIYVRRSSDSEDRQVQSLPAQIHWAREICARVGIVNPLVIEERRSAKTPGRPAFNKLLALIATGDVDTVVCWKADRLARNALDGGSILYALESKKLTRIITSDRIYLGQADEEFILHLELGLSAKFSKDLSKNTQRGMADKWRRGEWTGIAPLGYKNVRDGHDHGIVVVDEKAAPYVRKLFEMAATGNYSLLRLATIAEEEWRLNFVRRQRANSRRKGIPLNTIYRILKNPFYYGVMRVKGQFYNGVHPPLISKTLFDRVGEVLAGRCTSAERPQKKAFAFAGLIRCGSCGRRLSAYLKVKPSGRTYTYYVCSNRSKGRCAEPQMVEREYDAVIDAALRRLRVSADDKELCLRMFSELIDARIAAVEAGRGQLVQEIASYEERNLRLLDLLLSSTITQEDYQRKRAEFSEQLATAKLKLQVGGSDVQERIELARKYLSALPDDVSMFATYEPQEKKAYLRMLGIELVAQGKKVLVHAEEPTSIFLDRPTLPIWGQLVKDVMTYFLDSSIVRFFGTDDSDLSIAA
jgi:DNA invertase Pin-like site-specific DNA recombinase